MRPLEIWERYRDAIARRDWDAVTEVLDENVHIVDHRPFGFGELAGRAAFIEYLQGLLDLVPDTQPEITRVLSEDDRSFAAEIAVRGTGFEIVYTLTGETDGERLLRAAFYEPGDERKVNVQPE